MKNLMIYISPTGSFENNRKDLTNDAHVLIKIQIDNSLSLGWKREDLLLITNFNYKYDDVKATVFPQIEFFNRKPQASKINAIVELFKQKMIKDKELYWFHDLDAYQLQMITEEEIGLNDADMALTDYGVLPRWSTGVIYFKKTAEDIFEKLKRTIYKHNINEELALGILTKNKDISGRIKKIDKSYNFTPPRLKQIYPKVLKPIRVAHFHIFGGTGRFEVSDPVSFFKGENELSLQLITDELIGIFNKHGV